MIKTLASVGNSKAVVLPSEMVKKYKLDKVSIEETEDGILIRPVTAPSKFEKAINKLRKNKVAVYKRMESQANTQETLSYYKKVAKIEVDIDILEE